MLHRDIYRVITMCADMRTIRELQLASREFRLDAARQYMVRARNRRVCRLYNTVEFMIGNRRDGLSVNTICRRIETNYYVCDKQHGPQIYNSVSISRITLCDYGVPVEQYKWQWSADVCLYYQRMQNPQRVSMTVSEVLRRMRHTKK